MHGGFQVEDFGKAKNSTDVQFIVFQVQLSNLALSYSRKDFIVVCYTGKKKSLSQNTYSFSFTRLSILHCTTLTL